MSFIENSGIWDEALRESLERIENRKLLVRKSLNAYRPTLEQVMAEKQIPSHVLRAEALLVKDVVSQTTNEANLHFELLYRTGNNTADDGLYDALGMIARDFDYEQFRSISKALEQQMKDDFQVKNPRELPPEMRAILDETIQKLYSEIADRGIFGMFVHKSPQDYFQLGTIKSSGHQIEPSDALINIAAPGQTGIVFHLAAIDVVSSSSQKLFTELTNHIRALNLSS